MTDSITTERAARARASRRWLLMSAVATGLAAIMCGYAVLQWSQSTPLPVLADRAAQFAAIMRVVRPIVLLVVLLLWRPIFCWLHHRSWISDHPHSLTVTMWPCLVIWVGLVELTLGQGYLVTGLLAAAAYWAFLRVR